MKFRLILFSFVLLFLFSCSKKKNLFIEHSGKFGGTIRLNGQHYFSNLFPPSISTMATYQVSQHIFECLFKIDKYNLTLIPSLVEKWDLSTDRKIYTFYLRKGIYFHNDPCFADSIGREMIAADVEFSYYLNCTFSENNSSFNQTFMNLVKGANEYYETSKTKTPDFKIDGFKVVDDYTFKIELVKPFIPFLYNLTLVNTYIIPRESFLKYGEKMVTNAVGTGPFMLNKIEADNKVILRRNPRYWKYDMNGNQLPYLEYVTIECIEDPKIEFQKYKQGEFDMVTEIPKEYWNEVFDDNFDLKGLYSKDNFDKKSSNLTIFCEFIMHKEIFKNKNVRKAFNYAIDRQLLINDVLNKPDYINGNHGIVPPSYKNYDVTKVKGYTFDPELAEKYLSDAGYPNGKDFPRLTLQTIQTNLPLAEAIKKMLADVLHISIDIIIPPTYTDGIENAKFGKTDLYLTRWFADYPDPQNFLSIYYGREVPISFSEPSFPNTSRYINSRFDSLYEAGLSSFDLKESYKFLIEAENIMMQDPPLIVLYHPVVASLMKGTIKNLPVNPLEIRDLSDVYFEKSDL